MVLNSLSFCLSVKLLISPSYLMRSLLGTVIWVVGFSISSLLVCPAIHLGPEEFILKDQLLSLWESLCV